MRMLIWRTAASLVPTAVLAASLSQSAAFGTRTDLVAMTVTVLDNKGTTVGQLPEEAFTITEDGSPRPVAHFARGKIPLSIVVALDASESMRGGRFDLARRAVKGFVDRLGPEDEFTLIGFNDQPFTITPRSTSPETIVAALNRVEPRATPRSTRGVDRAR